MMKKYIIIFSLACLFLLNRSQAEVQDKNIKLGYVKIEYIFGLLPDSKRIEGEFKAFEQERKLDLERKFVDLQEKAQAFQKGYETMSEAVKKQKEKELREMQAGLQGLEIDIQETMANKHMELLKPVYKKIAEAVAAVAQEHGFTHILNADLGGLSIIVYSEPQYDVTTLVLKKLNTTANNQAEKPANKKAAKK